MGVCATSLDYQLIKVDIDAATTKSYATEYNCKDRANQMRNFVLHQS